MRCQPTLWALCIYTEAIAIPGRPFPTLTRTVNKSQLLILTEVLLPENSAVLAGVPSQKQKAFEVFQARWVLQREFGASRITRKAVAVKVREKHRWTSGYQEVTGIARHRCRRLSLPVAQERMVLRRNGQGQVCSLQIPAPTLPAARCT